MAASYSYAHLSSARDLKFRRGELFQRNSDYLLQSHKVSGSGRSSRSVLTTTIRASHGTPATFASSHGIQPLEQDAMELLTSHARSLPADPATHTAGSTAASFQNLLLLDLDPATAKLLVGVTGPLLSGFGFLFIARIVMSWYPKLPIGKFPYVLAYAPTEPILSVTRKIIRPVGGVDVTPVVWFGLLSFLNEILVGPQGLLVLLSQQVQ